jgi:addiction module HigA family antidote
MATTKTTKTTKVLPVRQPLKREPTHPGEILREDVLPALRMNVSQAARELGVSRQLLHRILAGRAPVTPEMAVRLGKWAGNGPALWLGARGRARAHSRTRRVATLPGARLATNRGGRPACGQCLPAVPGAHATLRRPSTARIHRQSWFQLANVRDAWQAKRGNQVSGWVRHSRTRCHLPSIATTKFTSTRPTVSSFAA